MNKRFEQARARRAGFCRRVYAFIRRRILPRTPRPVPHALPAYPGDGTLGLVLLRETIENTHKLQMECWGGRKMGPGAVALMLVGIETRLDVIDSMFRGDGEWRRQIRWPIVIRMLKLEEDWKAGRKSPAEAARRPAEGPGEAGSHQHPQEAGEGFHGAPTGIHGGDLDKEGEKA